MKKIMIWYFKGNLLAKILVGFVLGIILGMVFGESIGVIAPLGSIFINLLKMVVMPLILCSLVVGAASVHPADLGRTGIKIFLFYLITSAFAVTIGLVAANIFSPGLGLNLSATADVAGKVSNAPPLSEVLLNIIPKNIFGTLSSGKVLPTIFFAVILGIAISTLQHSNDERIKKASGILYNVFDAGAEIMYLIVKGILQYAPIGVMALIATVIGRQGGAVLGELGKVTIISFAGYLLQAFLVYGIILVAMRLKYTKFFKKAREAMLTAFVTRSSSSTLPVTMRNVSDMGAPKGISSFTLPLGATINMDGTAIYLGVCTIFIANAIGLSLDIGQQITVVITAVLASIGTAGVPGAGAIMLLLVLESIGLPMEAGSAVAAAYATILGIDAILDMGRTSVNITGDMVGTLFVSKSEKRLDIDKYNS